MTRAFRFFLLLLMMLAVASPAFAKGKKAKKAAKTKEDIAFEKRMAELKKDEWKLIVIKMKPTDDPTKVALPDGTAGIMLVANNRNIETPETLSPHDILDVINKHMVEVKKCYKKQLAEDPEWNDEMILDLSVKKNGRVSEVDIAPRRVKRDVIGQCLISTIPKWKFPEFTGESEDGVSQDVVNASFPFSMSPG